MAVLHTLLPIMRWLREPWRYAGALPLVIGLVFNLSGAMLFGRHKTPLKPGSEATHFVIAGVFRFSRNPMYLGFFLMLLGVAVLLGTLSSLLVPFIFAWLIRSRFIVHEERLMEARFGQTYLDYKQRTRRWL